MTIDPRTIRPGSTLVFKGRAEERHSRGWMVSFPGHLAQAYFEDEAVRHAEHIPAPKTFKRGDWVRRKRDTGRWPQGPGLVLGSVHNDSSAVYVSFDGCPSSGYRCLVDDLEPDEAPE